MTMAHSRESKFFLSGTVSPESVFRLNLQPNRCMPRMLRGMGTEWEGPRPLSASPLSPHTHPVSAVKANPEAQPFFYS